MPFHVAQRFSQVVRVWTIYSRAEGQPERFPVGLEEVSELLDLNERRGFERNTLILPHKRQQRGAGRRQFRCRFTAWLLSSARSSHWSEDAYVDSVSKRLERAQHPWLDLTPVQSAIAASEGWDSDGCDAEFADHPGQVVEAGLDVDELGSGAPVPLRGEVDDVPRTGQRSGLPYVHATERDLAPLAGSLVVLEHRGPRLLELQGDPLAHDALGVHGVDERIDVLCEEVPSTSCDRHRHPSEIPLGTDNDGGRHTSRTQYALDLSMGTLGLRRDSFDGLPRNTWVDEALRLTAFLAVGIVRRVVPVRRRHQGPVDEVIII